MTARKELVSHLIFLFQNKKPDEWQPITQTIIFPALLLLLVLLGLKAIVSERVSE